ncbi:putative RNA-directed DNA polymerase [Tanacetum coccineum]
MDVRYHWIHDALESKLFNIEKVYTDLNGADMMIKSLHINKHDTCYEITESLVRLRQPLDIYENWVVASQHIGLQFGCLRYRDGTAMSDHLNIFQGVIHQISKMGIKFDEEVQVQDGIISMELAKNSVLNEEMRRKSQGSSSYSDALVVNERGRNWYRGEGNRDKSKGKSKGRSKSRGKYADKECIGDVCLETSVNMRLVLRGIKHIPDLHLNLISADQALDVFKEFHASVEREMGRKLKCIRSNNGCEYSSIFDVYCKELGISHQKTPPKTP